MPFFVMSRTDVLPVAPQLTAQQSLGGGGGGVPPVVRGRMAGASAIGPGMYGNG